MFAYKAHHLVGTSSCRAFGALHVGQLRCSLQVPLVVRAPTKNQGGKQRTAISLKLYRFFSCLQNDAWIWVEKSSNASLAVPSLDLNLPVVISIRASVRLYNMISLANKLRPQDFFTTYQVERGI